MDEQKHRLGLEFKAVEGASPNAIGRIQGWASTNEVDSYNEIVEPSAFNETMADYMKHPIILFGHDWYDKPIGKVVDYVIDSAKGLWVDVELADTEDGRDVWKLIQFGILKAFSIGFWTLERTEPTDRTEPSIIKKLKLAEISVVNVPANAASLFEQARSLDISLLTIKALSVGTGAKRKEPVTMADLDVSVKLNEFEQKLGGFQTSFDSVTGGLEDVKRNAEKAERMVQQLAQKQADELAGLCTKGELQTFAEKLGAELKAMAEENARIAKALKGESMKVPFAEWKRSTSSLITLLSDEGRPLSDMEQKAYRLFNVPVDYKNAGEEGRLLKAARDAHDTLVIMDAAYRSGQSRLNPTRTKTFGFYKELLNVLDPEFSKAMYSTGTGLGDEWVNTGWSQELYDLYRLDANLEAAIPGFQMPTNPFTWPVKSSGASLYRMSEAATNNPATARQSNFGTTNVTFTAEKYGVCISASPEWVEDSIILVVNEIRKETAFAAAIGYESAIVNSDATANGGTHRDNASATRWNSYDPETFDDGLREIAFQDSKTFDTASTSTGVGDATAALAAEDFRYMRALTGVYGKNPKEFAYVVPLTVYFKMLSFTPLTQGQLYFMQPGTWQSGDLNVPFDGCQVITTSVIDTNQAATGLYTDGTTQSTYTSIIGFAKTGFKVGTRLGATLEFERNIITDQWSFVTKFRKSFKKMAPTGKYPVALGIKVTS